MRKKVTFDGLLEREALACLLEARGPLAIDDAKAALVRSRESVQALKLRYARGALALKEFLVQARALLKQIHEQEDRLGRIERLWNSPATAFDPPTESPQAGIDTAVLSLVLTARDRDAIDSLRRLALEAKHQVKNRLAAIQKEIEQLRRDYHSHGTELERPDIGLKGQDAAAHLARELTRQRRELEARLNRIAAYETEQAQGQGGRVAEAIAAAGGPSALAEQLLAMRKADGGLYATDTTYRKIEGLKREIADLESKLRQLGMGPRNARPGTLGQSLSDKWEELTAELEGTFAEVDARARKRLDEVIARASGGDEAARAEVESLVRSRPEAFPKTFLDGITSAQFERSERGYLVIDCILGPLDP